MSELRENLDTLPAGALRTEVLERGEEIGAAAVPTYLDHLTRAERRGDASEATLIRYTLTRSWTEERTVVFIRQQPMNRRIPVLAGIVGVPEASLRQRTM